MAIRGIVSQPISIDLPSPERQCPAPLWHHRSAVGFLTLKATRALPIQAVEAPFTDPRCPPTMPLSALSGSSATAIGLSGMRAAQQRLDTSAHNVANALTPGFQRQVVTQAAQPGLGGVDAQTGRAPEAASAGEGDFGHLAEDMVAQRMSVYSFAANLRTVETQDRVLGALLDAKA
jgi:flagellar basal body rod protein FlgB